MNTPEMPDDDFERELAALSKDYRAADGATEPHAGPPAAIDEAIRAAARRQVQSRPRAAGWRALPAWTRPLTAAAVVVLTVSVLFVAVDNDPSLKPSLELKAPLESRVAREQAAPASPAPSLADAQRDTRPAAASPSTDAAINGASVAPPAKPESGRAKQEAASRSFATDSVRSNESDALKRQRAEPATTELPLAAPPPARMANATPVAPPVYAPAAPPAPAAAAAAPQAFPAPAAVADARLATGALEKKEKTAATAPAAQSGLSAVIQNKVAQDSGAGVRADKVAEAAVGKADANVANAPKPAAKAIEPVAAPTTFASAASAPTAPVASLGVRGNSANVPAATPAAPSPPPAETATQRATPSAAGAPAQPLKDGYAPDAWLTRIRDHAKAMRWKAFDQELAAFEKAWPNVELPVDIKNWKAGRN